MVTWTDARIDQKWNSTWFAKVDVFKLILFPQKVKLDFSQNLMPTLRTKQKCTTFAGRMQKVFANFLNGPVAQLDRATDFSVCVAQVGAFRGKSNP